MGGTFIGEPTGAPPEPDRGLAAMFCGAETPTGVFPEFDNEGFPAGTVERGDTAPDAAVDAGVPAAAPA